MGKYLLDTNIILRLSNPSDSQHKLVTEAIAILLMQGDECYLTPQVLIELWVVATRPTDVNGLGWSVEKTHSIVNQLKERFPMADESPQIFPIWLNLVTEYQVVGKRTHDIRIVAAMLASQITHILTLNPKDFTGVTEIKIIHPQTILDALK